MSASRVRDQTRGDLANLVVERNACLNHLESTIHHEIISLFMTLALILSFEFTVEKTHCKYHGLRVRNQARGDLAKLMAGSDCGGGGGAGG